MILPFLLAALLPDLLVEAPRRRARVHELRMRLGAAPAPTKLPTGVAARLAWACAQAPAWASILQYVVKRHVEPLVVLADPNAEVPAPGAFVIPPTYRNLPLEQWLGWVGRVLARPLRVIDFPWTSLGLPYDLFDVAPTEETLRRYTRFTTNLSPDALKDVAAHPDGDIWRHPFVFLFHGPFPDGQGISSLEDRLEPDLILDAVTIDSAPGGRGRSLRYVTHLQGTTAPANQLRHGLPATLDWIEQTHPDLGMRTPVEIDTAQRAWHAEFRNAGGFASPVRTRNEDQVLETYPDGSRLVELRTKASLDAEGQSMGHCVGGYWPKVRDKKGVIWSLRSRTHVPLLTIELSADKANILQVKGPHNEEESTLRLIRGSEYKVALLRAARAWTRHAPAGFSRVALSAFGIPSLIDLDEMQTLSALLSPGRPDTAAFYAQVAKVLDEGKLPRYRLPGPARSVYYVPTHQAGRLVVQADGGVHAARYADVVSSVLPALHNAVGAIVDGYPDAQAYASSAEDPLPYDIRFLSPERSHGILSIGILWQRAHRLNVPIQVLFRFRQAGTKDASAPWLPLDLAWAAAQARGSLLVVPALSTLTSLDAVWPEVARQWGLDPAVLQDGRGPRS